MEHVLGKERRLLGELKRGRDTGGLQFGFCLAPNAPYVANLEPGERLDALQLGTDLAHPVVAGIFLGVLGCHFRQRLRRSDADGDGYAYAFADVANQFFAIGFLLLGRYMVDIEKTLIDGVLLKARGMIAEDGHHAVGEVTIEGEIR